MLKHLKAFSGVIISILIICFSTLPGFTKSDDVSGQNTVTYDIVKITIMPVTLRLFPGGSMQLVATAYNSKGEKVTVSPSWTVKSDVSLLGEFNKSEGDRVIFSAINPGNGSIIAVFNNLEAEVPVQIYKSKRKR